MLWCRAFIPAALSATLFCAASSAIILLNKWIVSELGFAFPMTLSLLGMVFSFAASAAICLLTNMVPRTVELNTDFCLRRAMPIGLLTALTLYFGNLAYVSLSVSFLQMLKASTPILVMSLMFCAGLDSPSVSMVFSVLLIAAGTFIAAFGEIRFSWHGVLAMTTSQFTEASKLVLMQLLFSGGSKMHALESLLCFSPFAVLFLSLGVLLLEWQPLMQHGLTLIAAHPLVFIGQAALGVLVNLLTILTVKYTSSISFKLISMAKNAAIVLLSVPVFHNPISPTQGLGYTVTVLGFGAYNYLKLHTGNKHNYQQLPSADGTPITPPPSWLVFAVGVGEFLTPVLKASAVPTYLLLYVVSGVFQPLFVMEMDYESIGRQLGLLYMLPYYLGMACVLPFSCQPLRLCEPGGVPWRKVCLITVVDFASQFVLMAGLTTIGSGLFTVVYASGPIWTALFAYMLLQRRISTVQKLALMLVVSGLAVAAYGSATLIAIDDSFAKGIVAVLIGTGMHALVYVLQEMTLVKETFPLEPSILCGLIGMMGTAVIGAHAAVFTAPVWHERVRPRPGLIRTFASSYGGKTITDFIHGWAYFNLMGQLGATSMSVMKAAVAASSFATSVAFFCNADCCLPEELPSSMSCPAPRHDVPFEPRSAFFCHYSPAQCFSSPKAASLALVLSGVLLYTRSGQRAESADEMRDISEHSAHATAHADEEREFGRQSRDSSRKLDDSSMRIATWRWLRR